MKKLLLLVMGVVMLMSVNVMAQGVGAIMLQSDALASSCNTTGNPSGLLVTVYVFHSFTNGVTASNFKIQDNGTGWFYIADQPQQGTLVIGSGASEGASYAYPSCVSDDFNFLNVLYQGLGIAGVCSSLEVVANPASLSGTIEGTDCSAPAPLKFTADGSRMTVNCPDEDLCGRIVPVESTNWGKVKALYSN